MIEEIRKHFENEYPREGCGLIGVVKGKKIWVPCTNLAEGDQDFILSPKEFIEAKKKADIIGIVHSHVHSSNEASDNDIKFCNALGIPYYIFSYPEMELNIVHPLRNNNPLIGREYEFGRVDCLEAIRDFYSQNLNISLQNRLPYLDDWWLKGENYFVDSHIKEWGFYKVEELEENDILIFTMGAMVPTHCGVYLGKDLFFHHAVNRLSCRENLYPLWKKYLTGIYRYGA
jgi:proteasome lid subunit RPN8/RPN11